MGCLLGPIFGFIKNLFAIIGFIAVIIVLVLGVCVWQLTKPPALEGSMHEVVYSQADAVAFDNAVMELEEWLLDPDIQPGESKTLTLSEAMVTAKIAEVIDSGDMPFEIKDIKVNFGEDGKIYVLGSVEAGLSLAAGLELTLSVEDGTPKIVLDEISIGQGFGVPDMLKEQIADAIPSEEALTEMLNDLPFDITSLQTDATNGNLIFTGTKIANND